MIRRLYVITQAKQFGPELAANRLINAQQMLGQIIVREPVAQITHAEPQIDVGYEAPFRSVAQDIAVALAVEGERSEASTMAAELA